MVRAYFGATGQGLRCLAAGTCTTVTQDCSSSAADGRVLTNILGGPIGAGGSGYVCDVGWTGCPTCVDWSSVRTDNAAGGTSVNAVSYAGDDSIGLAASFTAYFVR